MPTRKWLDLDMMRYLIFMLIKKWIELDMIYLIFMALIKWIELHIALLLISMVIKSVEFGYDVIFNVYGDYKVYRIWIRCYM